MDRDGGGRKRPHGDEEDSNPSTGEDGQSAMMETPVQNTTALIAAMMPPGGGGYNDVPGVGAAVDEISEAEGNDDDDDDNEEESPEDDSDGVDNVEAGESDGSHDSSSSSGGSCDEVQAAMIASFLTGGGHDRAAMIASLLPVVTNDKPMRAYFANYDTDPNDMPPPPSFPDEMAQYLLSDRCKSIVVLAGAGMSVSCGIPDFRSAGIGLYDTLRPELLTGTELERALIESDPTLALDKGMFLQNPFPMLETKRSFIIGTHERRWRATLAHRFVEMLHTKLGKLTRLYTQNIDGLEYQTRLPREKVINVHGSMGAAACELCGHEMDFDDFTKAVRLNIKDITGQDVDAPGQSTPIKCEACGKPTVKPTIVLFRSSMPKEFHKRTAEDLPDADLLIIMGTSLTVAPANSLVYRVPSTALRMVMNDERVGCRLGIVYGKDAVRDVWARGHTDVTCLDLAEKIGWLDDMAMIVDEMPESSAKLLRDRLARRRRKEEEGGSKKYF